MRTILSIVLCSLFWVNLNGQARLCGYVLDKSQPLHLAQVAVLKSNIKTLTDSSGYYCLENIPEGKHQLRYSYVGYENLQTEIVVQAGKVVSIEMPSNSPEAVAPDYKGSTSGFDVSLVSLVEPLNEVIVSGSLRSIQKKGSITPVEVYDAQFFKRNPVTNLYDVLYQMNGLFADVDNGVSNTTDVQIHGLEGNYTMYVIDGVPLMSGLASNYGVSMLPLALIDKVEVVKGASSTLYGSGAMAGVIHIKTKKPQNSPRFWANTMFTSMLESNVDVGSSFRLGKAYSILSVQGEQLNFRWDVNDDGFTDIPLLNKAGVFNKWMVPLRNNKQFSAYGRYHFEDRFAGQMELPSPWRGSTRYYSEAVRTQQWQAGLQLDVPIKEQLQWILDYNGHRQSGFYGFTPYEGTQHQVFSQLVFSKQVTARQLITLGSSYRMTYFTDNSTLSLDTFTGYSPWNHQAAVFIEDEIRLAKNHQLLAGARFEYTNRAGPDISPRLRYKWSSTNEKNTVRVGVGTGFRTPNVMYEGFGAMNGSRQVFIKEPLKAERAIHANAQYLRVQPVKGGILQLEGHVFYTYFLNFINPSYSEFPDRITYGNAPGYTATGFGLNMDFTFSYPLRVGVGLTYVYAFEPEEEDGEIEIEIPPHVPPLVSNFYLSYTFAGPQLTLHWSGNLVSPMLLSTVPDDFRPEKSPWYSIQNIQLSKRFRNGLELYAGIKNLFNFLQKDPILRPFDPYNRFTNVDNPNNYRFDTTYGFTTTQGIRAFAGLRYVLP